MFDIGFFELLLTGFIALVILGPERLPEVVHTGMRWMVLFKRRLQKMRMELERDIGVEAIRQTVHNEIVMKDLDNPLQIEQSPDHQSQKTSLYKEH